MRWLIVEDALRDRKGHWFEYLGTFARELRALGDEVTLLADRAAEPFLVEQLRVQPVLPASIWHRMGDGAGALRRYLRVPVHAWRTRCVLKQYFQRNENYDVIFVPTVLVHHLLGWTWLIKGILRPAKEKIILFFPNTPVQIRPEDGQPAWLPAPTAKLFCRLIKSLKQEVEAGRVILGAETQPMRAALMQLTGVPFTYFPHPVAVEENAETLKTENLKSVRPEAGDGDQKSEVRGQIQESPTSNFRPSTLTSQRSTEITFGSYGSARHEKGSDLLVAAVEEYCRRYPATKVRFVLQSVGGDLREWQRLENNPKVRLISGYFADGEYAQQLRSTDALLLPYRRSSYDLRVSRVVIEAMIHGLPVVATRGTTLASQAEAFGAAVLCQDGDVASLVTAIQELEQKYDELKQRAAQQQPKCVEHFSVRQFRGNLLG